MRSWPSTRPSGRCSSTGTGTGCISTSWPLPRRTPASSPRPARRFRRQFRSRRIPARRPCANGWLCTATASHTARRHRHRRAKRRRPDNCELHWRGTFRRGHRQGQPHPRESNAFRGILSSKATGTLLASSFTDELRRDHVARPSDAALEPRRAGPRRPRSSPTEEIIVMRKILCLLAAAAMGFALTGCPTEQEQMQEEQQDVREAQQEVREAEIKKEEETKNAADEAAKEGQENVQEAKEDLQEEKKDVKEEATDDTPDNP